MNEKTNRERFIRVAEARTNQALASIERVGDCADVRIYDYTPEQVEKIFTALENAIAEARKRFANGSGRKYVFRLSDEKAGGQE